MLELIQPLIQQLEKRVVELNWKLNQLSMSVPFHTLPRGLFRQVADRITPNDCIMELQQDLQRLARHTNLRAAQFLAARIQTKINVLVDLCQKHHPVIGAERSPKLSVTTLMSRQQWLQQMQVEIKQLEEQQQALQGAQQRLRPLDTESILNVQQALATLEQRITRLKEALSVKI